jgi:alkaline phosphatase D
MFTRRRFLQGLGALAVCTKLRAQSYPFSLGVASGYPTASGVTLWTRLTGELPPAAIAVRWEIASDDGFRRVVRSGDALAQPRWAHSIHADVEGLEPDRWYWYRFTTSEAQSRVGRTRTAPSPPQTGGQLRFAFASCQHYEQGFYGVYRHIVADEPDLIAFLGDYIYESSWGRNHVRRHGAPEPQSLDDYRARHALYRGDPDLQEAHAACPWILTWDDHEVDNDYAADRPEDGMERAAFLRRRAAAYRAYYEHMPLPQRMQPSGARMRIYSRLDWGALARFHVLDCRQYRSPQACPPPNRRGGSNRVNVGECSSLAAPGRSVLGGRQERWLEKGLAGSPAAWNPIAQTTAMAQFDQQPGPGRRAYTDGWDGYPAARERLLKTFQSKRVANPVVIGGDVHSFSVAELKLDFDDPASPALAPEFVTTSITSQAVSQERLNQYLAENPHIALGDSRYRGYTRVLLTAQRWSADLRTVETVQQRDAPCSTLASFVVETGRPLPLKA